MSATGDSTQVNRPGSALFNTTHWSVVLAAGRDDSLASQEALEKLCAAYWYPIYAFIRRRGYGVHEAEDLTQDFFARLLDKKYLASIQREGGKFRSFLLTALKHFLVNEREYRQAAKRGGPQVSVSFEELGAER